MGRALAIGLLLALGGCHALWPPICYACCFDSRVRAEVWGR